VRVGFVLLGPRGAARPKSNKQTSLPTAQPTDTPRPRHTNATPHQATTACTACYAPSSKDPATCASCVAGATGVPAAARSACFGCYLKTASDQATCGTCLAAAKTPNTAALCPLCAGGGGQKQCYSCMDQVPAALPGVKWLCHFTGTTDGNKATPDLAAATPRYFKCLAAAKTLEGGQACRKCLDGIEKGGAKGGDACFAALKA